MKFTKYELNLSTSLLYKISTCVIGILIPRLFILSYGSDINGLQSSIAEFFTYIALIEAGVGDASVQALFGPIARNDYKKANGVLSATTYFYNRIGVIYFMLLFAFATLYPILVEVPNLSYLTIFLYIVFAGAATGLNFFFQAKIILILRANGDSYFENIFLLASFLTSSAIKIWLILNGQSIVLIQVSYFCISLLIMCGYYILVKKRYVWVNFHEVPDKKAIEQKDSVLVHKISCLIFNNTDIILLTFICGLKIVSIYAMYKMVMNMVRSIIASFVDSFNYKLGQTYNNSSLTYYCKIVDSFNVCYSAFSFAMFTVASLLLLPFLRLYTDGMDMNYILPWLPYLYVTIEVLQIGRESMQRTALVAGHFKNTLNQAIIEAFLNLGTTVLAMYIFSYLWGAEAGLYGALFGTICALLYRTIAINIYSNRIILKRSSWFTFKIMGINCLLYILVCIIALLIDWTSIDSYLLLFVYALFTSLFVFVIYFVVHVMTNRKLMEPIVRTVLQKK